ncbi:hypothetical protein HDA40_001853 [Hamadaea flava]|uniref:Uncharacterized protein n=1 Tax=Hamadaea flava TaxID=1742688 RepID=A0ABV8LT12_9ACTN|nr:hypothetical protein [Hamadaea flava]MCP2323346.1 hypothetical protein [Hamadaea flava]
MGTPMRMVDDASVTARLTEPDYQLVWPRALFRAEAAKLLNQRGLKDWDDRCELLLEQAFLDGSQCGPVRDFRAAVDGQQTFGEDTRERPTARTTSLTIRQQFLRDLLGNADILLELGQNRRPYWRERLAGQRQGGALDNAAAAREVISLINEFDYAGYFDKRFGKDCVDEPRDDAPNVLSHRELGVDDLWPLDRDRLTADLDLFLDAVELLHDHVARPTTRWLHNYAGCGWHHSSFDGVSGRIAYRWRINRILARSGLGLRLAEEGEDVGRLVAVTDDARGELVAAVVARDDGEPADQVKHALALYRQRGADRNQKRSAVVALALVLEERRHNVLSDVLAKSDRGALFDIANNFHIRHQDAKQKRDYDDFYLDWIFWTYLATIELTNRVLDGQKQADVLSASTISDG